MAAVVSTHIEIDEHGVAWIAGANVKVIEVALDKIAHGWSHGSRSAPDAGG